MISFSGPTQEVEYLARQIALLGRQDFIRGLMGEMGDAAVDLVRDEFAKSQDPYWNAWAPLKRPRPKHIGAGPLVKSGKLQGSIRRYVSFAGFTLKARVPYAQFHQNGTRKMVARRFFPAEGLLPREWALSFEHIADSAIARLVREGRTLRLVA